jgi:hypothetical protein
MEESQASGAVDVRARQFTLRQRITLFLISWIGYLAVRVIGSTHLSFLASLRSSSNVFFSEPRIRRDDESQFRWRVHCEDHRELRVQGSARIEFARRSVGAAATARHCEQRRDCGVHD